MGSLSSRIAKNIDLLTDVQKWPEKEFPTHYHRLLYEIVSTLCDWLSISEDLIVDCSKDAANSDPVVFEAASCLGNVLKDIFECERISQKFGAQLLEVIFGRMEYWQNPEFKDYVLKRIASPGHVGMDRGEWAEQVRWYLAGVDTIAFGRQGNRLAKMLG